MNTLINILIIVGIESLGLLAWYLATKYPFKDIGMSK